jgi:hypothetical protein
VKNATEFRLGIERLEEREVPAFLAPISSSGGSGVRLAVGDFNHDGRDDVATFQGTIISSLPLTTGGTYDVVTLAGKTNVKVSVSRTDGTFERPVKLQGAQGSYLEVLEVRDWNSDGNLDVVARTYSPRGTGPNQGGNWAGQYTGFNNVWLGRGDGSFASVTTTQWRFASLFGPYSFNPLTATADFNRDGILDRATVDGTTSVVSVSFGNANGTFQPPRTFDAGASPGFIAVGDFNGDGWTDIVVVNNLSSSQPTLSVLLNDGNW